MDEVNTGIWIVRTQKHIQEYSSPHLSYYDATIVAGQSGRLMSRLRKLEVVEPPKLQVLASDLGILPSQLKNIVLPNLEKKGVMDVTRDGTGAITKIEENVPTVERILPVVSELWSDLGPTKEEEATIEAQGICSEFPLPEENVREALLSRGFDSKTVNTSLDLQTAFGILGTVGEGQKLIFSEYSWGEVIKKGWNWISHLSSERQQQIRLATSTVHASQGLPSEQLTLSPELLEAATKAGLLRVCNITTKYGDEKPFVFTPSVGQIYSDDSDEVKTFLACLKYGQNYSRTSRIKNPLWIINAMLDRETHTIGPATDIGSDYVLLEKAGIVKVERSTLRRDRFNMTLVKDDTARLVREILRQGTVSGLQDEAFASMLPPSVMTNPEQNRIRLTKIPPAAQKAEEELFRVLRQENL